MVERDHDDAQLRCDGGDLAPQQPWRAGRAGAAVNLERAMAPTDRLGGHIVQGHVDGTGSRLRWTRVRERWEIVTVRHCRPTVARYVVEKGSITVDGVSLTVSARSRDELFRGLADPDHPAH
ncbi:MAG: hypothetical protein WKG07_00100 [Hymenobacter sp.]